MELIERSPMPPLLQFGFGPAHSPACDSWAAFHFDTLLRRRMLEPVIDSEQKALPLSGFGLVRQAIDQDGHGKTFTLVRESSISAASAALRRSQAAGAIPRTCLAVRTPTIAAVTAGLHRVHA